MGFAAFVKKKLSDSGSADDAKAKKFAKKPADEDEEEDPRDAEDDDRNEEDEDPKDKKKKPAFGGKGKGLAAFAKKKLADEEE